MKKLFIVISLVSLLFCSVSFASEPDLNPVGKWAYAYDCSYPSNDIQYLSFDVFLLEDSTAYVILGTIKNGNPEMEFNYSDGLWISDGKTIKIKTKKFVFDAFMDDSGSLNLYFTDNIIFVMNRVVPSATI